MDIKRILLVVIVAIVVIATAAFLINYDDAIKYEPVNLSKTCIIDFPSGDNYKNSTVNEAVYQINDTSRDLTVLFYNSEDNSTVARVEFEFTINDFKSNATEQTVGNQTVWYNEESGFYMAFLGNPDTHDNIIILTKDKEILEHMVSSVVYIFYNYDGTINSTSAPLNSSANLTVYSNGTASNYSNVSGSDSTSNVTNNGYYWSGQDQDYIREYTDSNGVQHIDRQNGPNEAYDPNTQKHYTDGVDDTDAYNQDFN